MPLVRSLRRLVNATGFDVVRTRGMHNLTAHLQQVLKLYDIDTVLDVGANEGQFAHELRSLGFQGQIHSFEPVPSVFELLKRNSATDGRWAAHSYALGAAPGRQTINISEATVFSSFLPLDDQTEKKWKVAGITDRQVVEISTVDSFLKTLDGKASRVFLKMDTQGYDLQVFEGAKSSLERIAAVLTEISFSAVYQGSPSYSDSIDPIQKAGYSVSGIYQVARTPNLALIEADCVFVNTSLLNR
jgi:FkbM family methyltransferase